MCTPALRLCSIFLISLVFVAAAPTSPNVKESAALGDARAGDHEAVTPRPDCPMDDIAAITHHLFAAPGFNPTESASITDSEYDVCGSQLKVGAKIYGYTGYQYSNWMNTSAAKSATGPIALCGVVTGLAEYHYKWMDGSTLTEVPLWRRQDQVDVDCSQPRDREAECIANGGEWNGDHCIYESCPLLINLSNASYPLTSVADGVAFDIEAAGYRQLIAWTHPDSNVAFLALDRNHNGVIDDGSELFGSAVRKVDGSRATNGFDALRDLDGGLDSDGKIDADDPLFNELLLWRDFTHDGISQPEELRFLKGSGIEGIALAYYFNRRRDGHGNRFITMGRVLVNRGQAEDVPWPIWDVNFAR